MRSRLFAVFLVLYAGLLVALAVPLGLSYSAAQARSVYIDRLADLARFAELVPSSPTDVDERALLAELRRYENVYGIPIAVLGADGSVSVSSRPGFLGDRPAQSPAVRAALAGRTGSAPERLSPWDRTPLVVAQPVVRNGDVVGAVVSASDLRAARGRVLTVWALLLAGGALALATGLAAAQAVARWVLRPVAVLDDVAHRITDGDLGARIPSASGPPELRRLGESFNVMAGSVQASMESQRDFVADASHQLRNPLGALMIRLQGLALSLPEEHRTAAELAADDGRHLAETLDRMLELAKAEHLDGTASWVEVGPLVDGRLAAWQVVAARRGIVVRRTGEAGAAAWHEEAAIGGALDAVLDNAFKYAPEASTVNVDLSVDGGTVHVTVSDEGPGLDDEESSRATDRFWRSGRHPNVPGTGLGLSIATTLLARHGGGLRVRPGDERGLTVRLSVPAVPAARDGGSASDAVEPGAGRGRPGQGFPSR